MAQQSGLPQFEIELALLVLNYLEGKGWKKTATAFKKEAKTLLCPYSSKAQISKPLASIINDYLQLAGNESKRASLQRTNPLAQSIYNLLDYNAGLNLPHHQAANTMRAAVGCHMTMSQHAMQHQSDPTPLEVNLNPHQGPIGGIHHQQQQQQQQHQGTPGRHIQRKGEKPKKRRKLDADFLQHATTTTYQETKATTTTLADNPRPTYDENNDNNKNNNELFNMENQNYTSYTPHPSFVDPLGDDSLFGFDDFFQILDRPVDPQAILNAVDHPEDPVFKKFSETLAENINSRMHEDNNFSYTSLLSDPEFIQDLNACGDFLQNITAPGQRPTSAKERATTASPRGSPAGQGRQSKRKFMTPMKLDRNAPSTTTAASKEHHVQGRESPNLNRRTSIDDIDDYLDDPDEMEALIQAAIAE